MYSFYPAVTLLIKAIFRYETIHQVQCETHDVTVLVSPQQPGVHHSHWRDWLRDQRS